MNGREGSTFSHANSLVPCDCASEDPTKGFLDTSAAMKSLIFLNLPFRSFLLSVTRNMSAFCNDRKCLIGSYNQFLYTFWRFFTIFLLNKRLFIFLILLNPLLTESSTTQRVRHRHIRHTLRGDRLCDKPQVMDHPHDHECRRFRIRRDIHQMNLREAENTTMCDYRVCVDKNPNRMPQEIHRVFCVESGCRCQEEGSFRCTQLTDTVEVWYGVATGKTRVDRVEVEVGCVCAAKHGYQLDNFNPTVNVDK